MKIELGQRELQDLEDALEWSLDLYYEDVKHGIKYQPKWKSRIVRLLKKVKANIKSAE